MMLLRYLKHVITAFDVFVNVTAGGLEDETLSARIGRGARDGWLAGRAGFWLSNKTFSYRHSDAAIVHDLQRAQAVADVEELADPRDVNRL